MDSSNRLTVPGNVQSELAPGGLGITRTVENTNAFLQVGKLPYLAQRTVNGLTALQVAGDYFIGLDTTYNAVTLTLLPARTEPPYQIVVKWIAGTNAAKIVCTVPDTLDGATTFTFASLYDCLILLSVGNNNICVLAKF